MEDKSHRGKKDGEKSGGEKKAFFPRGGFSSDVFASLRPPKPKGTSCCLIDRMCTRIACTLFVTSASLSLRIWLEAILSFVTRIFQFVDFKKAGQFK